ncbi:MAG TPA: TIM barrel protein [Chloroflexota bacterium]|nr:TIM barrel protein [Chloroflexota bacterium]
MTRPRVLLKARPTVTQLRNRLEAPVPDGMELYIHEDDVSGDDWFATLKSRFAAIDAPRDFSWIVEGPVWSLDGELFGLCRNNEIDRELTRRLVQLASHLGATAVNVHCVDGGYDSAVLDRAARAEALERALPYLEWYVALCRDAGVLPLIENVPPICRMRRAAIVYSPIGVEADDLSWCCERVAGLGVTLDTSHAQLAVNAFRRVPAEESLLAAARYYAALEGPRTLEHYIEPLLPWIVSAHVSNAAGLLDEGLPYAVGDADLDSAVRLLARSARYFVTEPLDTDEDRAPQKRDIQAHLLRVLSSPPAAL